MDLVLRGFRLFTGLLLTTLTEKCLKYGVSNLQSKQDVYNRLRDKMARLSNDVSDEEDTWLDVAGYAAIGWLMHNGMWNPALNVYVAHPIDNTEHNYEPWAELLLESIQDARINLYIPSTAYVIHDRKRAVPLVNLTNNIALRQCDILLVLCADNEPSFGIGGEIEIAKTNGIQVWWVSETMPTGLVPMHAITRYFSTMREMIGALIEKAGGYEAHVS